MNEINMIPMLMAWGQTLRQRLFQVKIETPEWRDLLREYNDNEKMIRELFEGKESAA